jgi:hypothetical protein
MTAATAAAGPATAPANRAGRCRTFVAACFAVSFARIAATWAGWVTRPVTCRTFGAACLAVSFSLVFVLIGGALSFTSSMSAYHGAHRLLSGWPAAPASGVGLAGR